MKPLRYLFYRIWRWKQRDTQEESPLLVATMAVAMLLTLNVLAAIAISQILSDERWLGAIGTSRRNLLALVVVFTFFFALYGWWVRSGRYRKIAQEFATEPAERRLRNTICFWSYIVASILSPFLLAIVFGKHGN